MIWRWTRTWWSSEHAPGNPSVYVVKASLEAATGWADAALCSDGKIRWIRRGDASAIALQNLSSELPFSWQQKDRHRGQYHFR